MVSREEQEKKKNCFSLLFYDSYDQIKKDLKELEKITDVKKKYRQSLTFYNRHEHNRSSLISLYSSGDLGELGVSRFDTIGDYEKEIEKINKIRWETKKNGQISIPDHPREPNNPQPIRNEEPHEQSPIKNTYDCSECFKEKSGRYFCNQEKNDGNKLCSRECYLKCYGEICNDCLKKCLTYYPDQEYPDIVYCRSCWRKKQSEETQEKPEETSEEEQEWDPNLICRYCHTKTNSIFSVCENQKCLTKMAEEVEKKKQDYKNKEVEREREREREREQIQQSIKQLEQKPNKTPQELDELEELRKKLQELENLAKKPTRTEPNNSAKPWLIPVLVIGGILLIFGLALVFIRSKHKNK